MRAGSVLGVIVAIGCGTPTPHAQNPDPATTNGALRGSGATVEVEPHAIDAGAGAGVDVGVGAGAGGKPSPSSLVATSSRKTRIESPHGGSVVSVAITADGASAISVDELGGIRLWPALDASVEPRAVDMPAPRSLAIGRDARGFVVGFIDENGGAGIVVVDRDGIVQQRAALPADPPYESIAMSEHGLVTLRSDQQIQLLAADGSVISQVASEPGKRVVALAVSGTRAVAAIDVGNRLHRVRWLTLSPKLAWSSILPAVQVAGTDVTLSPSGNRLSYLQRSLQAPGSSPTNVVVVDTANGKIVGQHTAHLASAALVDDSFIAVAQIGQLSMLDVRTMKPPPQPGSPQPQTSPAPPPPNAVRGGSGLAVGRGRAIAGVGGDLAISTPDKPTRYLGYDAVMATVAAPAPGGLVFGSGSTLHVLDPQLRGTPLDLGIGSDRAIADLRWLGGTAWLVETSRTDNGMTAIDLVDAATKRATSIRRAMSIVHILFYEPSTKLVTISLGDLPEVLRYDPAQKQLDRVAVLAKQVGFERTEIVPVVPALAGGTQLVVVTMREKIAIRWVRDPRQLESGPRVELDGSLASVDATGNAYVWQAGPDVTRGLRLVIYRDGKQVGTLPTDGPTGLWPDPKGTRVVQVAGRTVALVEPNGTRVWARAAQGVVEALWLDDGSIALVSSVGVARLDAATGEVLAARCGFELTLSATPHRPGIAVEPLCTQLR